MLILHLDVQTRCTYVYINQIVQGVTEGSHSFDNGPPDKNRLPESKPGRSSALIHAHDFSCADELFPLTKKDLNQNGTYRRGRTSNQQWFAIAPMNQMGMNTDKLFETRQADKKLVKMSGGYRDLRTLKRVVSSIKVCSNPISPVALLYSINLRIVNSRRQRMDKCVIRGGIIKFFVIVSERT